MLIGSALLLTYCWLSSGYRQSFCLRRYSIHRKGFELNASFLSTLGTPSEKPLSGQYTTTGGVAIEFEVTNLKDSTAEIDHIINNLDDTKGVLLTSSYEYPGRYARWTVGFLSPPVQIEGKDLNFSIIPLNSRGLILVRLIRSYLVGFTDLFSLEVDDRSDVIVGSVLKTNSYFNEEERSQQPSLFSLVRKLNELFQSQTSGQFGLYGTFGYDLAFQFEPITQCKERGKDQRDLLLYLPDEIVVVDNYRSDSWKIKYEFQREALSTFGLPRERTASPYQPAARGSTFEARDTDKGEYAKIVDVAKEQFRVGNLFEVVLR